MRASKIDEDGPGFPLAECSKPFVQKCLTSLLLNKQRFRIIMWQVSELNWYWNCISLPFFLQRQKELFLESGFRRFSFRNWECCKKRKMIFLLEKLEWKIQFQRNVELKKTKTQNFEWHVWVWTSFHLSPRSITKLFSDLPNKLFFRVFKFSNHSLFLNIVLTFKKSRSVNTISVFTTNQPTCLLSTSFWTAISHFNALIASSSPSSITYIVTYHTE